MFRVRGEELQRADGEPELVRVRELPDAHAEGNQLVARDARRPFHDILADVIHALLFFLFASETRREREGQRTFVRAFARAGRRAVDKRVFPKKRFLGVGDGRKPRKLQDVVEDVERGTAVTEKNLGKRRVSVC
jgi:hypothetical protein